MKRRVDVPACWRKTALREQRKTELRELKVAA